MGSGLESDTVISKVNTFASETGSFDLTESGLESETVHLKVNTFASLGKSFTNFAPMISPADAQAAEKLYQLAEIIRVSRTLPGTLGLWALVVDAAPCNASAMSEGLLATLIQEDNTESEEPAARCDQDSLLERAIRTGRERYEEGDMTSMN